MSKTQFFIFNGEAGQVKRLRTSRDPFMEGRIKNVEILPTREGLHELNISGSSQFDQTSLESILGYISEYGGSVNQLVVCDLRGEPHLFINGRATSWYNKGDKLGAGLNHVDVSDLHRCYLESIADRNELVIYDVKEKIEGMPSELKVNIVDVNNVMNERTLVRELFGCGYQQVPIVDHEKPEVRDADRLIAFYSSTPLNTWWHFHCAGGQGRTTTAMIIVDMLANRRRNIPFEDYLKRHYLIGGANFTELTTDPEKQWKYQDAVERVDFLKSFYEYTHDADAHQHGLIYYSSWLKQNSDHSKHGDSG